MNVWRGHSCPRSCQLSVVSCQLDQKPRSQERGFFPWAKQMHHQSTVDHSYSPVDGGTGHRIVKVHDYPTKHCISRCIGSGLDA
jgi:hypothetical protein